jgi:hypothetical protein
VIAVSGGGWGVGDLPGAVAEALRVPDALVLCLCGRNERVRTKISERFADEPRVRVMGFTNRMSDVLAAADALVHSSAGLTILEAIIRGCPVISYGFAYGHVRATNTSLQRFDLAQVAHSRADLLPAVQRALEHRPAPDGRFAERPSTATLIANDERRVRPVPAWRQRTLRAATAAFGGVLVAAWALSTGTSYSLVAHFAHIRPVTAVAIARPEVGVLVNAPAGQITPLASQLEVYGIHASFAVPSTSSPQATRIVTFDDQALPRLPSGIAGLSARGRLHRLRGGSGHFLYASNAPSIGQWLFAHHAGGRPVAGAVSLHDGDDALGHLRPGEVVEISVTGSEQLSQVLGKLVSGLESEHLSAVSVGRLMRDAGTPA